jgi:hypothetical protein
MKHTTRGTSDPCVPCLRLYFQRPRKLTVLGSDGRSYNYLLKGHEDLRQVWPFVWWLTRCRPSSAYYVCMA